MTLVKHPRWILLAMAFVAIVAFACSSDGDDNGAAGQSTAAAPAAATAPVAAAVEPKVQRLVISTQGPSTETNNQLRDGGVTSSFYIYPMYESLIRYDAFTGQLVPQLAKSWSVEPDGKSLRFKLQEGVQFHNGNGEFTARDVVQSHAIITAYYPPRRLQRPARPIAKDSGESGKGDDVARDPAIYGPGRCSGIGWR